MRRIPLVVLLGLLVAACDPSAPTGGASSSSGEDRKLSAKEARYVEAGRPFADAVVKQDYAAAYSMISSHLKPLMSLDDLTVAINQAHADYFTPHHADPPYVVEMDPKALAGEVDTSQDKTSQAIDRMSIERYVGTVSEVIAPEIRRASVTVAFYDKDKEDMDVRSYYLTFLLVEDEGQLKVGHFFFRWHDMLD